MAETEKHILAERDYIQGMKYKELAEKYSVSINTVKSWKKRHNWVREKGAPQTVKNCTPKKGAVKEVKRVMCNPELSEKEKLFCLHYWQSYNATASYQKAYGCKYSTAGAHGFELLRKPTVKAEIQRLQQLRAETMLFEEGDLVEKQMRIAFADINDFLEWGQEEVPVMTKYGPLLKRDEETGEDAPVMKTVNYVRFRPSNEVDGSLISEVKNGRDGAGIKLHDAFKARDWLSKHFEIHPEDKRKAAFEARKMAAEPQNDGADGSVSIHVFPASQMPKEEEE